MNTIPTEQKAKVLEETRDRLQRSTGYIVLDYRGLTVSQISQLRRDLRAQGAELEVIKNTLFRMAATDTNTPVAEEVLHGPTAVAFAYDDPVASAKGLTEFLAGYPKITIKGGGVEGHTLTTAQVNALAKTPPRPIMLGQFAGILQAPMGQLAGGLNALPSKMAQLLQALVEKQGGAGATAEAAPAAE